MSRAQDWKAERPRCHAITTGNRYVEAHQCPYQVEPGHEQDDPKLCTRCRATAQRRAITLIDGRTFRLGPGVTPPDTE